MSQISISVKPDLIKRIDGARGSQSRSSFIVDCVIEHINPTLDIDKKELITQLNAHKDQQRLLEDEVDFLRQQYSLINAALSQKLLSEPKKLGWFARHFRKE
jgi:metal-responsive CopG/Arc/MetJ family transcriptional regulator